MRIFEQAHGVRVILCAGGVAQNIGQETRDGVDQDQRGKFAACQHVIANGDFICDKMLADAFIDPFVAAAEQNNVRMLGKFLGDTLVEDTSLWG